MSEAVTWERIPRILERIPLKRIRGTVRVPFTYAGFNTETLLKIHLLPYLAPLKSERALAFELAERPELQLAVGLTDGRVPTRATLWHFRRRNLASFRTLMKRSLTIVALDADRLEIPLPFATKATQQMPASTSEDTFDDPLTSSRIWIYTHPTLRRSAPQESLFLPLPGFADLLHEEATEKEWLYQVLGFPILAQWEMGFQNGLFSLTQPSWLDSPYGAMDLEMYLGKSGKAPYTACNVLVVRQSNGREELLLSRRLRGSGAGTYTVPGGKKLPDETLVACVKRELREEVGLEYRDGRPISVRTTDVPGFPLVRSVGVIATDWKGEPRRLEHLAHWNWEWYPISKLPEPLFFPTQMAIDDYRAKLFANLDWNNVEEPLEPFTLWSE